MEANPYSVNCAGCIERITRGLQFFGIWQLRDSSSRLAKWAFRVYTTFVLVCFNLTILAMFYNLFYMNIVKDMELFLQTLLISLVDAFTNLKIFYVIKFQATIRGLVEMVKKPSFQPRNQRQVRAIRSTFRTFGISFMVFRFFPNATVILWDIYALLIPGRQLPNLAKYPYDYKVTPYYELTFFHQALSNFYIANLHAYPDCLLYALMATGVAQLQILTDNVKHVFETTEKTICGGRGSATFQEELNGNLDLCIEQHKNILLYFKEVYAILSINILGQFAVSTGSLCLTIFQASGATSFMTIEFFAIVSYAGALLSQLFFYCYWGNEVMLKSQEVPIAAFESNWREAPISYQKKVIFFIHRTQEPIVMMAVDFFRLTIETFMSILRTSYSCYAVLHTMKT